jgi:hypothetical protein
MGTRSEGIGASGDSENSGSNSGEAHYVSVSPQEDRSVRARAVGKVEGAAKEGSLEGGAGPMHRVSLKDIKTDPLAHELATSEGT